MSFFWHNMQDWLFKKKKRKKKKTCGKRLQTDFSVRQVPALPSAFSFTSLSVCSQPIPSIHPSLSLSPFPSSTNQISVTPSPCAAHAHNSISSRSLEEIQIRKGNLLISGIKCASICKYAQRLIRDCVKAVREGVGVI